MNPLQQRRQQQLQQTASMQPQQNEFMAGFNAGNSLGNIAFSGVGGRSDGKYGDIELSEMEGFDKNLSDKQNFQNMFGGSIDFSAVPQQFSDGSIGTMNGTDFQQAYGISQSPLTNASQMNFGNYSGNIGDYIAQRKRWF